MKKRHLGILIAALCVCLAGLYLLSGLFNNSGPSSGQSAQTGKIKLTLQDYGNNAFSLQIPQGWEIATAGDGSTLSFVTRDPSRPLRQIFYFGAVGPLYMSQRQKQIDLWYLNSGGYPISWIEMPVIEPFTPSDFFKKFHLIARTKVARNFMPQCPKLDQFQIISVKPQTSFLPGGKTELIRALFLQDGQVAEGLFTATMIPFMAFMNGPGGGNGYGCMVVGVAAPQKEFRYLQDDLIKSLRSFTVNQAYAQNYLQRQEKVFAGILKAGRTLSEASEIIADGWEARQQSEDISAEKRGDAILGKERLYDPDTKEVYEFDNGFYDKYNLNRNNYERNNLELLEGNNYDLWMRPALNGPAHLR